MGRMMLINSVMDSQLTYAMSALQLPQGVIDALDRRRRAFLWAGGKSVSGAQCLVAWENACVPKDRGGIGIRDLAAQNKCLLLKLFHRLHHPGDSAWVAWVRSKINLATLHGNVTRAHWSDLNELLPAYRAITSSEVFNGMSTSFWHDQWLSTGRLNVVFPLLYTHATDDESLLLRWFRGARHLPCPPDHPGRH
jgi:hypothetical protein